MDNLSISQKGKIGIVTLYHNNYNFGGLLQAYALTFALKQHFDIPAEQIDYAIRFRKQSHDKFQDQGKPHNLKKIVYERLWLFAEKVERKNFYKRKAVFAQFINDIPHSEQTYTYHSISISLGTYTKFICGGDQIWNDYQVIKWYKKEDSEVFTLQFVPEHIKKISYAPSMAVPELTDAFRAEFSSALNRLDAISVREKRSLPVLEQLTHKPIKVVVDPVLLLQAEDWLKVTRPAKKRKRYVLCYLLGDHVGQRKAVQRFAKKMNRPIITFPHILGNVVRKCDLFFGDVHDYTSGPREFLDLICHADLVVTDSFHACVLSMIFKTPFVVFERSRTGETENMSSRIYDFLEEYHLEHQLVTEKDLAAMKAIPEIDFTYAHEHWKKRREESLAYLENALKDD